MARSGARTRWLVLVACSAAAFALVPAGSAVAAPSQGQQASTPGQSAQATQSGQPQPFDLREGGSRAQTDALRQRGVRLQAAKAVRALSRRLGPQGVVDMDPLTATPRQVARLDGMLTGPSGAPARKVALGYVRDHAAVFHLSANDITHLTLARDYVDIAGIHHLSFTQSAGGLTLFGNGLKANVTKDGRLINVSGSPVPGLSAPRAVSSAIGRTQAIRIAKHDTGERNAAPRRGDTAKRVLFQTPGGTRRAWQTVTMGAAQPTLDVVDAQSGRLLYRQPLTDDFRGGDAGSGGMVEAPGAAPAARPRVQRANVVDNFPGADHGGHLHPVRLNQRGWLPRGSVVLFGNNVHTYADVNDNDAPDPSEEIGADGRQGYRFPLIRTSAPGEPCDQFICTWDPSEPFSWRANESRTATQNFYFINRWHDHLEAAPIGFTEAAGNFQEVNFSGQGTGGDPVQDEPLDGASVANGLPDGGHIDNANFATPPDGQSPRMQMFLWHEPGTSYPDEDPFIAASGADESDIVFHEYTHGLSHRLITDASNNPALDSQQGGSMGEAWSDWYAADYLVDQHLMRERPRPGDILVGSYVVPGQTIRSEPMDCPVGTSSPRCPGSTQGAGPGGYTYGDFGKISSRGIEVHADGEIWSQTLWDVRGALGSKLTESLVTRGMELSPTFPSMLDMRNAIIQADQAIYRGRHVHTLWQVFAHRGMGFFAGTADGNDTHPVESFSTPPPAGTPRATVTGTVTDTDTGEPLQGVAVAFGGHNSGFPGDYAATTGSDGTYTIDGVFPGTYPDVFAGGAGFNPQVRDAVAVNSGTNTIDWQVRRDWAASSGGATIVDFNGPDYSAFGCGPAGDIDQSQGIGWGSDSNLTTDGQPTEDTAKFIIIALPATVDIERFAIDPSNTCGDGASAATGDYKVETSPDGETWQVAATGTFTPDDLGTLVDVTPTGTTGHGVQFVRFWMLTPQLLQLGISCPSSSSGCLFMDSSEVEVFGAAATG